MLTPKVPFSPTPSRRESSQKEWGVRALESKTIASYTISRHLSLVLSPVVSTLTPSFLTLLKSVGPVLGLIGGRELDCVLTTGERLADEEAALADADVVAVITFGAADRRGRKDNQ